MSLNLEALLERKKNAYTDGKKLVDEGGKLGQG